LKNKRGLSKMEGELSLLEQMFEEYYEDEEMRENKLLEEER